MSENCIANARLAQQETTATSKADFWSPCAVPPVDELGEASRKAGNPCALTRRRQRATPVAAGAGQVGRSGFHHRRMSEESATSASGDWRPRRHPSPRGPSRVPMRGRNIVQLPRMERQPKAKGLRVPASARLRQRGTPASPPPPPPPPPRPPAPPARVPALVLAMPARGGGLAVGGRARSARAPVQTEAHVRGLTMVLRPRRPPVRGLSIATVCLGIGGQLSGTRFRPRPRPRPRLRARPGARARPRQRTRHTCRPRLQSVDRELPRPPAPPQAMALCPPARRRRAAAPATTTRAHGGL